jgi:hypothetical protein
MQCQHCGNENTDQMRFCGQCGQSLAIDEGSSATEQGPAKALPGTCQECSYANPEAAKFCEGCGAELFEICPECSKQSRIRVVHCASCGVQKTDFRLASESLAQARIALDEYRYPDAAKSVDQGLAHQYFAEELSKIKEQAVSLQRQLDKSRFDAETLVEQGDMEQARLRLKVAIGLSPKNEELKKMMANAEGSIRSKKVDRDMKIARDALADGNRFKLAIKACEKVLKRDPHNADGKELMKHAKSIRDGYRNRVKDSRTFLTNFELDKALELIGELKELYPWDEHLTFSQLKWQQRNEELKEALSEAQQSADSKNYRGVFEACSKVLKIVPKHDGVEELRRKAQKLKAGHDQGIADAQVFIEQCKYDEAREVLTDLLADFEWDERIRPMLDEVDELVTVIENRRRDAKKFEKQKNWKQSKGAWRRLQRQIPNDPEAAAGIELATLKIKRKAMRLILSLPILLIFILVGAWIGWNFYQMSEATKRMAEGEAGAAQRHVDRLLFPIPAVWKYQPVQEQIDKAVAIATKEAKGKAELAKKNVDDAYASLPTSDDYLRDMRVFKDGTDSREEGDKALGEEDWAAAQEKYEKSLEHFKTAKILFEKKYPPGGGTSDPEDTKATGTGTDEKASDDKSSDDKKPAKTGGFTLPSGTTAP